MHLVLKPSEAVPNLHVIALQEDMYHPEDQTSLLVPPLVPVVRLLLKAGALGSNINTRLFNLLGAHLLLGS